MKRISYKPSINSAEAHLENIIDLDENSHEAKVYVGAMDFADEENTPAFLPTFLRVLIWKIKYNSQLI